MSTVTGNPTSTIAKPSMIGAAAVRRLRISPSDRDCAIAAVRCIDSRLTNPQNLVPLARSVMQAKWPDSAWEMFEQACRVLAEEPDGEHLDAIPSTARPPGTWPSLLTCRVDRISAWTCH